jgi:glycosyltransferase involved in cell wall biosynthesis
MKITVLIPVYNEVRTIEEIVRRVKATELITEILIVDDGSTDGTREILTELQKHPMVRVILHEKNLGKGAAVRTGIQHAACDFVLIQDADLEYDPRDYTLLLEPLLEGRAPVIYGSRFLGGPRAAMSLSHTLGNQFLTIVTNVLFGTSLSDMETCYKCFRRDVISGMTLRSRGFEIEPELTAKILKRGYTIFEAPISYNGRTFHEGKKIGWQDGFAAVRTLVKYRFVD